MNKKGKFGRITENNVDEFIQDLSSSKGDYIIQSVSFSKHNPLQMELLRMALTSAPTFSGFIKDVLTMYKTGQMTQVARKPSIQQAQNQSTQQDSDTDKKTSLIKRSKNNMLM